VKVLTGYEMADRNVLLEQVENLDRASEGFRGGIKRAKNEADKLIKLYEDGILENDKMIRLLKIVLDKLNMEKTA
jgi:hypothetical protein